MSYTELLEKIGEYVTALFQQHENPVLIYHNLDHTKEVVHNAISLSTHHRLAEEELFVVQAAAWFHDVGYLFDMSAHEKAGADEALKFLSEHEVEIETIDAVRATILATRMPQTAVSLVEKIVCDADLFHLGTTRFREVNHLVREERSRVCASPFSDEEWLKGTISLLEHHTYQTEYCRKHLGVQKQKNLEELQERLLGHASGTALGYKIDLENSGDENPDLRENSQGQSGVTGSLNKSFDAK